MIDNVHAIGKTIIEKDDNQGITQLYNAVKHSIRRYLYELDGAQPHDMYDLVLRQVEQPLLEAILEHTKGNQSNTEIFLGVQSSG